MRAEFGRGQARGARLPLTRHPANGTSPPTRARSASERLLLHAALTISPSAATAGPQHPLGVATAPCTQPYLLDQALTVSFPSLSSLVSPTWLHPFGGFGLSRCNPCYHAVETQARSRESLTQGSRWTGSTTHFHWQSGSQQPKSHGHSADDQPHRSPERHPHRR